MKEVSGNVIENQGDGSSLPSAAGVMGTLQFAGASTVTGTIGAINALTLIDVASIGAVNLGNNYVKATTIKVSPASANDTATRAVPGNGSFEAAGTYNSSNLGQLDFVDFANNAGTVPSQPTAMEEDVDPVGLVRDDADSGAIDFCG